MKKVLFVSEFLNPPYDEGIKKTVYTLHCELLKRFEVFTICRYGKSSKNVLVIDTNPLFLSVKIHSAIKSFKPDATIYFPFQSSTFASYLRQFWFAVCSNAKNNIFIALQPKPLKNWEKYIAKKLFNGTGITPSKTLSSYWQEMNIRNYIVPLNTDLSIFSPVKGNLEKMNLRRKYGVPENCFIISHMGHLNEGRNLRSLIPLQSESVFVLVVSSSSTPGDAIDTGELKRELTKHGIMIIDESLDHIEEVYKLSDLYVFPVVNENSSIGLPLSILEARACGIPVLTTNYGSVQMFLKDDFGGIVYSEPEGFSEKLRQIMGTKNKDFSQSGLAEINNIFIDRIEEVIMK